MTYMNSIGPEEIARRKTASDEECQGSELLVKHVRRNSASGNACIAYSNILEKKRLADELKEVWE